MSSIREGATKRAKKREEKRRNDQAREKEQLSKRAKGATEQERRGRNDK